MKNLILVAILLAPGTLLAGCRPGGAETVLLQGAVTIGPINPVEIPGQPVIVSPEVFAARKIIIYDGSGKKFLREVSITQIGQTAAGYYTVQLAPGSYTIDINRLGIDNAFGLPKKITIAADETVTLDIDIDTGIR
jgi:hypothetical protein